MKKVITIILIAIFIFSLTACSGVRAAVTGSGWGSGDDVSDADSSGTPGSTNTSNSGTPNNTEAPDMENLTMIPDAASGEALEVPNMWVTEHGAYYVYIPQPDLSHSSRGGAWIASFEGDYNDNNIALLRIIDKASGRDMVLCNRPTCPHDSEDCGAFLPEDPTNPDEYITFRVGRTFYRGGNPCLFVDGEYVYALNGENTFYRFGLDGSGRTEYFRIPDEYQLQSQCWLMNGKLYMSGYYMVPVDEYGGSTSSSVLLEIDYINKTMEIVWDAGVYNENSYSYILGLSNGKIYFMDMNYPPLIRTQQGITDYNNNSEYTITTLNPSTGEKTIVLKKKGEEFSANVWQITDEIFYHSRKDQALFKFNMHTGETTRLADNLPGFIYIGEERDGRLFLSRDGSSDNWFAPYMTIANELFFFDFATGEITEITIMSKRNYGEDEACRIEFEEDGYFYIITEYEMKENNDMGQTWYSMENYRVGRIPKEDYWVSNASAIEDLGWHTNDEWNAVLAEKLRWW
ncbi:MAG: hypothetical protein FWD34_09660 [Oscillospiraceae bacterium]|nr:hypothetical protein [Oscillospiraceae bacterium]